MIFKLYSIISPQNPSPDVTEFETDFADEVELSQNAQDLRCRRARTANPFTDELVNDEQVKAIYDLANWAPTSMNNQHPAHRAGSLAGGPRPTGPDLWRGQQVKERCRSLVAILAADHAIHEKFPRTFPHFPGARDMVAADNAMGAFPLT